MCAFAFSMSEKSQKVRLLEECVECFVSNLYLKLKVCMLVLYYVSTYELITEFKFYRCRSVGTFNHSVTSAFLLKDDQSSILKESCETFLA